MNISFKIIKEQYIHRYSIKRYSSRCKIEAKIKDIKIVYINFSEIRKSMNSSIILINRNKA